MYLLFSKHEWINHSGRSPAAAGSNPVLMMIMMCFVAAAPVTAMAADADTSGSSHNWRLHGRLQADGAQFDSNNPLFVDDAKLRRARVVLLGNLWAGWRIKLESELTGSTPGPKSIYLRHDLGKNGVVTLGHFKEAISLQTATSSRYSTFMERALPNVDSPGYRVGAKFTTHGEIWSSTFGVTGGELTDKFKVTNDGTGVYFRGVLNPATSKKHLWHFGIGSEVRNFSATDTAQLRSRPESDLTDVRMVDTLMLADLDQGTRYTAEFAWKRRAVHFQSEYFGVNYTRANGAPDLKFDGWYAQAGWFITGETRKYNRDSGSFGKTKPKHSYGAWEVAARVSEIDLNSAEITGGKQNNVALALNWYATDDIRLSLNYIDASARPDGLGVDDDVSIIQARFQFIF